MEIRRRQSSRSCTTKKLLYGATFMFGTLLFIFHNPLRTPDFQVAKTIPPAATEGGQHVLSKSTNVNEDIINDSSKDNIASSKIPIRNDYLHITNGDEIEYCGPELLWDILIAHGTDIMISNNYTKHLVTFEVGAHRAKQSVDAAQAQFHTHVFEPSPLSFNKIKTKMSELVMKDEELEEFIHLHNVAVGSTTGQMLDFSATGRTGDHVGEFDIWNMKPGRPDYEKMNIPSFKRSKMVQIPSMKLDDLIIHHSIAKERPIDDVYAMKIDTQGFEPQVFAGLEESIKQHKVQYLLTEYWPNGMALMNNRTDKCDLAMEMLDPLVSAGYSIYALPIVVHGSITGLPLNNWTERPLDLRADCEYILNFEKRYPNENYHLGYWTDYLFVAPNVPPVDMSWV